jgi:hypothetical protein
LRTSRHSPTSRPSATGERKSLKLFLINGGYHTLQFTIIGLVLALLPCKDCGQLPCP